MDKNRYFEESLPDRYIPYVLVGGISISIIINPSLFAYLKNYIRIIQSNLIKKLFKNENKLY